MIILLAAAAALFYALPDNMPTCNSAHDGAIYPEYTAREIMETGQIQKDYRSWFCDGKKWHEIEDYQTMKDEIPQPYGESKAMITNPDFYQKSEALRMECAMLLDKLTKAEKTIAQLSALHIKQDPQPAAADTPKLAEQGNGTDVPDAGVELFQILLDLDVRIQVHERNEAQVKELIGKAVDLAVKNHSALQMSSGPGSDEFVLMFVKSPK